jgi:protein SCO1/2
LKRHLVLAVAGALVAVAASCGDDDDYAGYTRDPAPNVDVAEVPDLSRDREPFRFVADPGHVLVAFFGYTNCPDVCPTTLAELRRAVDELDEEDAARVDVVMVSIDPQRDRDVVADYITSFVAGAHAVALDDDAQLLLEITLAFGISYNVTTRPNGSIDVSHSNTTLFAVDDTGTLLLTWPFPVESGDIASDLELLLDDA